MILKLLNMKLKQLNLKTLINKYPHHLKVNINKGGYTKLYQKHVPSFMGAKLVCVDNRFTLPTKIFTDSRCSKEFLQWVFEQEEYCNQIINKHFNEKLKMAKEDEENYQNSQNCWICDEKIINNKDKGIIVI